MGVGMRGRIGVVGLVVGIALGLTAPAWGLIQRLTPLDEVLKANDFIFTATVEKIDPDKPSMVLKLDESLKGKAPFSRLPVNLTGDAEAKKLGHTPQFLKRIAVKLPIVLFALKQDRQLIAFGYTNGTWFQMTAQDTGGGDPVWAFAHCEPYLRRTFKGTTDEMKEVVKDGLSGKKKPPAPNPREAPGLGPEVEKKGETGEQKGDKGKAAAPSPLSPRGRGVGGEGVKTTQLHPPTPRRFSPWSSAFVLGETPPHPQPLSPEGRGETGRPAAHTRGPLFAVIPSVALGGILSLLAMLFPAVFGGVTGQLKRWLAVISVISLNFTLVFLQGLLGEKLQGTWWNTEPALWLGIALVTACGLLWAWRRHLTAITQVAIGPNAPERPPLQPGRGELVLLWVLGGIGVGLFVVCRLLDFSLTTMPWSLVLAMWVGIWAAALHALYVRWRSSASPTRPPLPAEGVMLWGMVPAAFLLGLSGTVSTAGTVETGNPGGARLLGEVWAFTPDGNGFIASSPTVDGNRVYTAAAYQRGLFSFGKLYCLDSETGKEVWSFSDDGKMKQVFSSPCVANGRLYVGEGFHQDSGCKLYCLDAATGQKIWDFTTGSHTESSPTVADGKVFFGAGDDGIYALDAATGKELWHFDDGLHVDASPLVVGGRLYVGSGVGDLHRTLELVCLDTATGKPLWRVPTDLPAWGTPVLHDGLLYVGLGNGNFLRSDDNPAGALLCVRADDGQRLWRHDVGDGVLCRPVVDATSVYFVARDGYCYALERKEGKPRWKFDVASPGVSSPALVPAGGGRGAALYVAGSAGRLCCLNPDEGTIYWTFNISKLDAQMLSSPQVVPHRGAGDDHRRVYIGAGLQGGKNAVLYCLEDHWPR